jgi:hypothetical protein
LSKLLQMRICIVLSILIIAISCSTTHQDKIDRILLSDEFSINVYHQGCFGDSNLSFKVLKEKGKKIFEYPTSIGDPYKILRTNLTVEKEKTLREFIENGMKERKGSFCISISTYKVGTFWNNLSFEDRNCELYEYLERLMK